MAGEIIYDILFSMIDFIHNNPASKLEGSSILRDLETSILWLSQPSF